MKIYYDKSYKFLKILKENKIYLWLYHDYEIFDIKNRKFYHQCANSFKVFDKIDMLIYRLELLFVITIHFIVFIIQLKSISAAKNSYFRL